MNKVLNFNWIKTLFIAGVFLVASSILFHENYRNIPLIIFVISAVLCVFVRTKNSKPDFEIVIINSLFFLLMLSSLIYTENIDYGLKRILVMVALFIMPISFYLIKSKFKLDYSKILKYFYIIFFISAVIFFIGVLIQNYFNNHLNEFIFRDFSERLNSKYGKFSMHPVYASLYVSIALVFAIPIYSSLKKKSKKALLLIGVLFLSTILVLMTRKGIIAITFIIFLFYFLGKQQKHNLILYGMISLVLFLISYNIPDLNRRYLEFFNVFLGGEIEEFGSTSIRMKIYDCSINGIINSPIFGYGIGDAKTLLSLCYQENNYIFEDVYLNSHNQFISAWLSSGIAGFLSLIAMVVFNFKLAFKRADFVHISVMFLFFFAMMTENILERQNGVILFSFIINFFAFKSQQSNTD